MAITVISVRPVHLDQPVPVYDATVPEHHNYALANGVVIHNTAKYARYKEYQEVLKLKGKPLNCARATLKQMTDNEAIRNIIVAIGYKNGKARVGHVYLLSDPDADACLAGDTLIATVDGLIPIATLATSATPFLVYACTKQGHAVYTTAIQPRRTVTVTESTTLTFSCKTKVTCTLEHKWRVPHPTSHSEEYCSQTYVQAQYLQIGDSVVTALGLVQVVQICYNTHSPQPMYCFTVPATGNFCVGASHICSANSHINVLILTALWKYVPQLFQQHRIHVIISPLYSALHQGVQYFAEDIPSLRRQLPHADIHITRIKGWGEATSDELRQIAFNPATRNSYTVLPPTTQHEQEFFALVGEQSSARKILLGLS